MAYELPDLPYAFDALEPHFDAKTMEIHHDKHHAAYVANVNAALEGHPDLQEKKICELTMDLGSVPEAIRAAVRNNGGGHFNHTMFWEMMSPKSGAMPSELEKALVESFGSVDEFKSQFSAAGAGQFGSGWAWLVKDTDGGLKVTKTENGVNPLCFGQTALLGCDVWEHSYYIDFRNKRPVYLTNFLDNLVNWENVASRM